MTAIFTFFIGLGLGTLIGIVSVDLLDTLRHRRYLDEEEWGDAHPPILDRDQEVRHERRC